VVTGWRTGRLGGVVGSRLISEDDSLLVMAGHSRLKDGVASARLCPAIHVFPA